MSDNLKQKTVSGVIWKFLEKFSVQGFMFIQSIIMARLLDPSDYGLIAMVAILNGISAIFIDIFPIDAIPDGYFLKKIHSFFINIFLGGYYFFSNCSVNYNVKNKKGKWKLRSFFYTYLYRFSSLIMDSSYNLYEKSCGFFNKRNSQYYSTICLGYDSFMKERSKYAYSVFLDFEFLKIPVPYRYEEVLSNHYGNWQKYVKGTSLHGNVLFDVNKSYLDI